MQKVEKNSDSIQTLLRKQLGRKLQGIGKLTQETLATWAYCKIRNLKLLFTLNN